MEEMTKQFVDYEAFIAALKEQYKLRPVILPSTDHGYIFVIDGIDKQKAATSIISPLYGIGNTEQEAFEDFIESALNKNFVLRQDCNKTITFGFRKFINEFAFVCNDDNKEN